VVDVNELVMPTTGAIQVLPQRPNADVAAQPAATSPARTANARGILTSVVASVAFAALFGIPSLLDGLDAFAAFGWRIIAALPFLALILTLLRQWPELRRILGRIRRRPTLALVLIADGLLFGVQTWLFAWGPMSGNALAVSMGYFLLPLMLVALGVVLYRERLSGFGIAAVSLAVVGVVVALATGASISWATFAVTLGYPAYFVLRRRFNLDSPAALALEMTTLLPIVAIFVLQPHALAAMSAAPMNWTAIALLGALTAIGFATYSLAQRALPMSLFGMLSYLEPVLLVVVSIALLGESLTFADALTYGAIALAIGMLSLDGLPKSTRREAGRRRRPRARATGRPTRRKRRPTTQRDDATAAGR
jgi:chloramphenicol-sensitive protein RarD